MSGPIPGTVGDDEWQYRLKIANRLEEIETGVWDVLKLAPTATADLGTGARGWVRYCTDGDAGAECLAVHDGTGWKVVSLGATVSTT